MTYLSNSDEGQAIMPKNSARPKLQFLVIKSSRFFIAPPRNFVAGIRRVFLCNYTARALILRPLKFREARYRPAARIFNQFESHYLR
jgi:hypothetical protein